MENSDLLGEGGDVGEGGQHVCEEAGDRVGGTEGGEIVVVLVRGHVWWSCRVGFLEENAEVWVGGPE